MTGQPVVTVNRVTISERKRTLPLLSLAFLLVAAKADGQQPPQNPPPAPVTADTGTVEEGRQAGKAAAGERRVQGRLTTGYVGGLAIGTLGPFVFQRGPLGQIGLLSGLAIIGAAWRLGDTRPPRMPSIGERGDAYRRAYAESYEKTLRSRRGKAALVGGVAGTVAGIAILLILPALIIPAY